ncbi:tRNA 2-thiouridine synthesizing protein C [Pasteurella testudinis DSM 23072]|uniref:tRNA 2-thiouridine synthesizing protein C n=1 Tax=Pasteurella testudinis DSM 23072 TaxID=1122938 RepID=A0A1W1UT19_9PAST|nr:sulfurtransferase complex subunit TusC [Pasteurella testudinis]SMB84190.1 tRNA 2-thiouridine synthesizing protein C [Pasteurella testudinis DSM 23072]SUB50882.1 protein TusC [Pasteurella testudinis]
MKLAFVFTQSPFGSSATREGLDALLAATAFVDEDQIGVFFVEEGVLNLRMQSQPHLLWQKDTLAAFKLLDLYEIEQRYSAQDAWQRYALAHENSLIKTRLLPFDELMQKLATAEKVLTF